jgi:prepilin-type N-terminal cleavage/methylation domain-containing protein
MKQIRTCKGFTLVEVVLAVAILALMVSGVSALYFSGFQSLDIEDDRMLLDSRLRGRMERLIGRAYGALSDGSDVVAVKGQSYTIDWTVTPIDLNGDATPEPNAVQLTVSVAGVPGASLTTIVVDHEGKVGKI